MIEVGTRRIQFAGEFQRAAVAHATREISTGGLNPSLYPLGLRGEKRVIFYDRGDKKSYAVARYIWALLKVFVSVCAGRRDCGHVRSTGWIMYNRKRLFFGFWTRAPCGFLSLGISITGPKPCLF